MLVELDQGRHRGIAIRPGTLRVRRPRQGDRVANEGEGQVQREISKILDERDLWICKYQLPSRVKLLR